MKRMLLLAAAVAALTGTGLHTTAAAASGTWVDWNWYGNLTTCQQDGRDGAAAGQWTQWGCGRIAPGEYVLRVFIED